jgi:hypothetical protein
MTGQKIRHHITLRVADGGHAEVPFFAHTLADQIKGAGAQ